MAKQRLVVYVPEGVYDEIMTAALRAERPAGWVITQAWNSRGHMGPVAAAARAEASTEAVGLVDVVERPTLGLPEISAASTATAPNLLKTRDRK